MISEILTDYQIRTTIYEAKCTTIEVCCHLSGLRIGCSVFLRLQPVPNMRLSIFHLLVLFGIAVCLQLGTSANAQLYWIGGSGDWDDGNHWSQEPGGRPAMRIPDANTIALIDDNSGLKDGSVLAVPPGTYQVATLGVTTTGQFTMNFNGDFGTPVVMEVFQELFLSREMNLAYNSLNNKWRFTGSGNHSITTNGQDLLSVEFFDVDGRYSQRDPLLASTQIRMYGGEWTSNNQDVRTELLFFRDLNNPPTPALTKIFNAGTSDIVVGEWDSRFTYQSLTVTGEHRIFVRIFDGSPSSSFGPGFAFNEIHLLEQQDGIFPGAGSIIESNNFECPNCIIDRLIIEDTGDTRLANNFTIEEELVITEPNLTVLLNGGNNRDNTLTINGTVSTPPAQGCGERVVIASVYRDFFNIARASGTLTIPNVVLEDIPAVGNATFNVSNGQLLGASTGWNLINQPSAQSYIWVGESRSGVGDWDDPGNWRLQNGDATGCIPSLLDKVTITDAAQGDINIPSNFTAECKDFIWATRNDVELNLAGRLKVAGDFLLDRSTSISVLEQGARIIFSGTTSNEIETAGVTLPNIYFTGESATWNLTSDLSCGDLFLESGTLNTSGSDIRADNWTNITMRPKTLQLGSSHVNIAGTFDHSSASSREIDIEPGTSLIECANFESLDATLYDLRLRNTAPLTLVRVVSLPFRVNLNRLLLNGSGPVRVIGDLTVEEIEFEIDEAALEIQPSASFTVNGSIAGPASSGSPPQLRSRQMGTQAELLTDENNMCITGVIDVEDMLAVGDVLFHAPDAIDGGNNSGFNFDNGNPDATLYWRGNSGLFSEPANWSAFSGGCPEDTNPLTVDDLIITRDGIQDPEDEIEVVGDVTANNLTFQTGGVILDVTGTLTLDKLTYEGSSTLRGGTVNVSGETLIGTFGTMVVDLNQLNLTSLTKSGGAIILREGSVVTIDNQ